MRERSHLGVRTPQGTAHGAGRVPSAAPRAHPRKVRPLGQRGLAQETSRCPRAASARRVYGQTKIISAAYPNSGYVSIQLCLWCIASVLRYCRTMLAWDESPRIYHGDSYLGNFEYGHLNLQKFDTTLFSLQSHFPVRRSLRDFSGYQTRGKNRRILGTVRANAKDVINVGGCCKKGTMGFSGS